MGGYHLVVTITCHISHSSHKLKKVMIILHMIPSRHIRTLILLKGPSKSLESEVKLKESLSTGGLDDHLLANSDPRQCSPLGHLPDRYWRPLEGCAAPPCALPSRAQHFQPYSPAPALLLGAKKQDVEGGEGEERARKGEKENVSPPSEGSNSLITAFEVFGLQDKPLANLLQVRHLHLVTSKKAFLQLKIAQEVLAFFIQVLHQLICLWKQLTKQKCPFGFRLSHLDGGSTERHRTSNCPEHAKSLVLLHLPHSHSCIAPLVLAKEVDAANDRLRQQGDGLTHPSLAHWAAR